MKAQSSFAALGNGSALSLAELPEMPIEQLTAAAQGEIETGARLACWFGALEGSSTRVICVLARDMDSSLEIALSEPFAGSYPSVSRDCPQAHMFERELWEQFGVTPSGHPWLKPVRKGCETSLSEFFKVHGGEIHEVAVGPVHAGVIEPGHFRFQCAGERVLHLEIALGYQHRGVEAQLPGGPNLKCFKQIETVAGDSTIAHASAYCMNLEALAALECPLRGQWLRSIALELERLANHTGDLGALANDVTFQPTSSACGKLRGDFLNMTALLCGNRFGRGLLGPGGCSYEIESSRLSTLSARLKKALEEVQQAATWLWEAASARARFEGIGVVSNADAAAIGLVGPAARASGLVRDVRYDHPVGWHRFAQIPVAVWPGGDVFARARVRWLEIQRSGAFLLEQLEAAPEAPMAVPIDALTPNSIAVSLVEGWRGETCHVAVTDGGGRFARYKITDPSFHNWTGLALAMRDQAISDFPICNKSFNLSYCGFDL